MITTEPFAVMPLCVLSFEVTFLKYALKFALVHEDMHIFAVVFLQHDLQCEESGAVGTRAGTRHPVVDVKTSSALNI